MEHATGPVPGAPVPAPARSRGAVPSTRPALIVVGIAAGLVLLFGVGAALTGSGSPAKPASATGRVRGTALRAEPATATLRPIERPGTPPSDVLSSIVLPVGTAVVSSTPWNGATQFNGKMTFHLPGSQAAVVAFYRAELKANGWSISSVGAARGQQNATEVLAQRASSDGWYWEIGIVVSPTTFSKSVSASSADSTRFSLDLFQEPQTA